MCLWRTTLYLSEMENHYTTKGNHLTLTERHLIERWKNEGFSHRQNV